jgi:Nuclease-related domain
LTDQNRSPIKERPLRLPGQSTFEQREKLIDEELETPILMASFLAIVAILEWYRYWKPFPPQPWVFSLAAVGGLSYAVWRLLRVRPQLRRLRQAIDGERAVGQFLEQLREKGYRVFHDVLGEGFNVDHVVIGPAGVVTVETKTWSKPARGAARILFEGDQLRLGEFAPDRDPLIQARAQARWMEQILSESTGRPFPVRAAVVFPGWFIERKAGATKDVWVLEPKALPSFLDQEPERMCPEDIALASFHLSRFVRVSERERLRKA